MIDRTLRRFSTHPGELRHSFQPGRSDPTGRLLPLKHRRIRFSASRNHSLLLFICFCVLAPLFRGLQPQQPLIRTHHHRWESTRVTAPVGNSWEFRRPTGAPLQHYAKMIIDWLWLALLCAQTMIGESLPTNLMEDSKKTEQIMRPKPKRAQEILMFGNQQNRQAEPTTSNSYTSNAEKRSLSSSGLSGLKAALTEEEKGFHAKPVNSGLYDRDTFSPYDKNYDYGKMLVNELGDEMPQVWDVSPYSRYYMGEVRRKRSEKTSTTTTTTSSGSTTARPSSTSSFQLPTPTQQSLQPQVKRSVPIYQEPRFKREVDIDPEDVLTLLSLWENERRNRGWRKYINDEFETEDESNLLDEEDPRNVLPWMDAAPMYQSRHYGWRDVVDNLSPSDIGIVRTHPPSYYDQYGNQQYESTSQYGTPQYGLVYPQGTYYNTPEKRFMVSRKRSQSYEPYSSAAHLQLGSQSRGAGYPYQQHRLLY